jgi:hypothetical protein
MDHASCDHICHTIGFVLERIVACPNRELAL